MLPPRYHFDRPFVPGYIPLKYVLRTWQGTVTQLERGRPVSIGSMFHVVAGDRQRVAGHGAIVTVWHPRASGLKYGGMTPCLGYPRHQGEALSAFGAD